MFWLLLTGMMTTLPTIQANPPPQPPANTAQPGNVVRNPNVPATATDAQGIPGQVQPDAGMGMINVNVEGTWTVLAYERNGSPVGWTGARTVAIRGNVMTLQTGDPNQPTKTLQLRFGPRNTIFITEIDQRVDGNVTQAGATTRARVNPKQDPATAVNPGNQVISPRVPTSQETGVYVLSREFFCVSVFDNFVVNMQNGAGTPVNQANPNTAANPNPPAGQRNIIASPPGGPVPGSGAGTPAKINAVLVLRRGTS